MRHRLWPMFGFFFIALAGCAGNDAAVRHQVEVEGRLETLSQADAAANRRMAEISDSLKELQSQVQGAVAALDALRPGLDQNRLSLQVLHQKLDDMSRSMVLMQSRASIPASEGAATAATATPRAIAPDAPADRKSALPQAPVGKKPASELSDQRPIAEKKIAVENKAVAEKKAAAEPPRKALAGSAKEEYAKAFALFNAGNYGKAIEAFDTFLKSRPQSEYAPNALYWSGECYYSQKQYQDALAAFKKVVADYPKANKVPDALLKIGYTLFGMKDQAKAKVTLRSLIERYPKTPAASKAREKLARL